MNTKIIGSGVLVALLVLSIVGYVGAFGGRGESGKDYREDLITVILPKNAETIWLTNNAMKYDPPYKESGGDLLFLSPALVTININIPLKRERQ